MTTVGLLDAASKFRLWVQVHKDQLAQHILPWYSDKDQLSAISASIDSDGAGKWNAICCALQQPMTWMRSSISISTPTALTLHMYLQSQKQWT